MFAIENWRNHLCCSQQSFYPPLRAASPHSILRPAQLSQGENVEEAIANLREATELFLEEFPQRVSGSPVVTTFEVLEHACRAAVPEHP